MFFSQKTKRVNIDVAIAFPLWRQPLPLQSYINAIASQMLSLIEFFEWLLKGWRSRVRYRELELGTDKNKENK